MKKLLITMSIILKSLSTYPMEAALPISETLLELMKLQLEFEEIVSDGKITQEEADSVLYLNFPHAELKLKHVEDLVYFRNLTLLDLDSHLVHDLNPLRKLTQLSMLNLSNNQIIDVTPLKDIESLMMLQIENNYIDLEEDRHDEWLLKLGLARVQLASKPYVANLLVSSAIYTFDRFDFDTDIPITASAKQVRLELTLKNADQIELYLNENQIIETIPNIFDLLLEEGNNRLEYRISNQDHTVQYVHTIYYSPAIVTSTIPQTTNALPSSTVASSSVTTTVPSSMTSRTRPAKTTASARITEIQTGVTTANIHTDLKQQEKEDENTPAKKIEDLPNRDAPLFEIPETGEYRNNKEKAHHLDIKRLPQQDIRGMLYFHGADIQDMVLQSNDNHYYLNHNGKQEKDKRGALFFDYRYDQTSSVQLIYGHHMRDGSMFGKLLRYKEPTYADAYTYAYLHQNDNIKQYEVIGAFYYDTNQDRFDYTNSPKTQMIPFFDERWIYQRSEIGLNDQLLLLSTCNYDEQGNRFIVVLKKLESMLTDQ